MNTFDNWWDAHRSEYHWSLKDHYKPVWDAAIEAAAEHIRPFNIEFIDDAAEALLEDLKTS